MQIDQTKMEEALQFLATTDEDYARLRALANGLDRQLKTIKALAFRASREQSVGAREHDACCNPMYTEHLKKIEVVETEFYTLHERRNTAVVTIDCWRSLNAARNRGMA